MVSHVSLTNVPGWIVRDYTPADERMWVHCRALAFLDTSYFDDVVTSKPDCQAGLQLVATNGTDLVGVLDASIDGDAGTIDTLAVHPDHRRRGIAGGLWREISARLLAGGVSSVDAWTRDDERTLAWYRAHGFHERSRYLHVYASTTAEARAAFGDRADLMPITGFFHAWTDHETRLREEFRRVHICRQFATTLG
jgi:ribosomal protein S18 acetylase RimI-like enzyme